MSQKKKKTKQKSTDAAADKRKMLEEEQIKSPLRTMIETFLSNKLAIIGMIGYFSILLACFIIPIFYPVDLAFQDSSQQNIRPGYNFMNIPKNFQGKAAKVDAGSNFAIGLSKENKIFLWGELSKNLKEIPVPADVNIVDVSAGKEHVLVLDEHGKIHTWGSKRHTLDMLPFDLEFSNIIQIEAGYDISLAVDDTGYLHTWGNPNIIQINTGDYQGSIKQVQSNNVVVLALLDDKTVVALTGQESNLKNVPEALQGQATKLASTDRAAAAIGEDGKVYVWGNNEYNIFDVPEDAQGRVVDITGGKNFFTVILDDGSIRSWGDNTMKQTNIPDVSQATSITADYMQNYVVDSSGNVEGWGLKGYLMGTDQFGRDIFSRMFTGGRISMLVGLISVFISAIIGITLGGFAGYYGGRVDFFIMRFGEVIQGMPFLPLAIVLSYIVGNKVSQIGRVFMIMVIQGFLMWPSIARLMRGQILSTRENEYVVAAQAMGVPEFLIIFKHIFPNIIANIIVTLTIRLANSILYESSLSFLGFGIVEPIPTWGNMLNSTMETKVIRDYWWRWIFPGLALSIVILSINLIGDGLRDAIDPKSVER